MEGNIEGVSKNEGRVPEITVNNLEQSPPLDENGLDSKQAPRAGVKYRVQYKNVTSSKVVHSIDMDGLHDHATDDTGEIFDVITTFYTDDEEFEANKKPKEGITRTKPHVRDTRKKIAIHIHSLAIIHALRSVVKYYPDQILTSETIVIEHPFAILVHHEKELSEYRERCRPSQTDSLCQREKNAYHHLKILFDFLEQIIMPAVRLERERNKRGFETFDMMWLRLKPGATLKCQHAGTTYWYGAVVEYAHEDVSLGRPWSIGLWTLDYDGSYIGPCKFALSQKRFEGEQKIVYICVVSDLNFEEPVAGEVEDLVERGRKFYRLLTKSCQYYQGDTFKFPHNQVEGLAMVDMKEFYSQTDLKPFIKPKVSQRATETPWVTDCSCFVCQRRKEDHRSQDELPSDLFQHYHGIYLENTRDLTPHQFFLLPLNIWAFVFKTRTWEQLHVTKFKDPEFQQGLLDTLVMDSDRVKTLKALASSYIRKNKHGVKSAKSPWNADFIQGKGRGQIILLHGPPGVGKTCTAECIAEYTQRPLMIFTSSDIGANPEKIEKILSDSFKRASSWGAVLLIDEADVFMEERSTNDLKRNCLVAGFLRALEFYDGILFLTTNRIGTFDDAFISRIHVKLYYGPFNHEERQKVWQTFVDKLTKDRGSTIRVSIDAKEYIKSKHLKDLQWNGREIRNAFQTAVALAEYEADTDEEGKILLKDTHLRSVVEMSREFQTYLENMHGGNEHKRASIKHIRHDDTRESF